MTGRTTPPAGGHEHGIPADLAELHDRLDRLALADRAEPDDGFEGRVAASVLRARAERRRPIGGFALALAASIAVAGGAISLWVASAPPSPADDHTIVFAATEIEEELELLLAWSEEDLFADSADLETAAESATQLGDGFSDPWTDLDELNDLWSVEETS